jgi:hypothetical protein
MDFALRVRMSQWQSAAQRDILAEIRLPAEVRHAPGAARELANIDADERRGQQAGGRQHAETAAHVLGDAEHAVAFPLRQRKQVAFALGGDRHDAARGLAAAERLLQPVAHNQKRGHRLRRAARFRDRHHQRPARVHGSQRGCGERGIDVIENHQSRMLRGEGALHGVWAAYAAVESPCAQRTAADAGHAHGVETAARFLRVLADGLDHASLEREVREPVTALIALPAERFQGL